MKVYELMTLLEKYPANKEVFIGYKDLDCVPIVACDDYGDTESGVVIRDEL